MTRSDRKVLKDSASYFEARAAKIAAIRPAPSAEAKKLKRKFDYLAARLRQLQLRIPT